MPTENPTLTSLEQLGEIIGLCIWKIQRSEGLASSETRASVSRCHQNSIFSMRHLFFLNVGFILSACCAMYLWL
jgi:hypothetical protein